jgi:hypothetical protein
MVIKVFCPVEREWIDEDEVTEMLEVWEGPTGEDILLFVCPICDQRHESRRVGRYNGYAQSRRGLRR